MAGLIRLSAAEREVAKRALDAYSVDYLLNDPDSTDDEAVDVVLRKLARPSMRLIDQREMLTIREIIGEAIAEQVKTGSSRLDYYVGEVMTALGLQVIEEEAGE